MLIVTAQAAEELRAVAEAEITDPEEAFRLVRTGPEQLGLTVDRLRKGEETLFPISFPVSYVQDTTGVRSVLSVSQIAEFAERIRYLYKDLVRLDYLAQKKRQPFDKA